MPSFTMHNLDDLPRAAKWVLAQADGKKKIMLYGQMGSGKTTFANAICRYLGVKDRASSPTFSLVNEYYFNKNNETHVIHHLDLYRLKNLDEALDISIEDYLYDDNYCLIEWPELIEPIMPIDVFKIKLENSDNSTRKIVIL